MPLTNMFGDIALDATLVARLPLNATSELEVADDYPTGQVLADQTGAAGVLTFTFASPVQLIWILAVDPTDLTKADKEVRVDPFGGVPAASLGVPVGLGVGFPFPVTATTVRVFAPAGIRVTVWGQRR